MRRAVLALADGTVFEGQGFGASGETIGEVVFNTSPFGYEEILTDPSYVGQIVTMAYPEMGNVGVNPDDEESVRPHAVGMVVRSFSPVPSNWRAKESLDEYLRRYGVVGIEKIDTRKLVRHLRTHGAQMGVLFSAEAAGAASAEPSAQALVAKAKAARGMEGRDLATPISTRTPYEWTEGSAHLLGGAATKSEHRFDVVAIDYGLKKSMLRFLVDEGCRVTVVPASATAEEILARKPHGVFLTNGPGDPAAVKGADATVAGLLGKVPIFGICLGHQILARALGGTTYKLKFGHRGANQPVKDLQTGKVEITSHNHGFAVDARSLEGRAVVSHLNLNDHCVEGLSVPDARAFSVQYHPESSPGPHDARHLFARFSQLMSESR